MPYSRFALSARRRLACRPALAVLFTAMLVGCGGGDTADGPNATATENRAHALAVNAQQAALAKWTAPIPLSLVPAAGTVLDANRVLFWAAGHATWFDFTNGGQSVTTIYDFRTGTAVDKTLSTTESAQDMFCPGTARLADGRLLVAGGNGDASQSTLYDPSADTWKPGPKLNVGRAYNASVPLGDGSVLTFGGSWNGGQGAKPAELWTAAGGWTTLPGISTADTSFMTQDTLGYYRADNHMWLVPTGNGKVLHAGPSRAMHWLDVTGNGSATSAGSRGSDSDSMNGNAVMIDAGKILTLGGGLNYDNAVAKSSAFIIDTTRGSADVHSVVPMAYSRAFANAVVLPNGQVVVLGGQTISVAFSDDNSVLAPEIYDPATESFTTLPAMSVPRNYHSIGLLMADGRVISAGSGLCNCSTDHLNMQVLSPPYLFNADGSAATRPVLSGVPATVAYGGSVSVTTDSAVTSFAMVRIGASTHTVNNDQRRMAVSFVAGSNNTYQLAIPSNPGILLPGQWMLFAMNAQGTPSVASIVTVGLTGVAALKNPGDQAGTVGAAASVALVATGASRYSATGLPPGTAIDASTGRITGTPTVAGTYNVSVYATSTTATVSTDFVWAVAAALPPSGTGLLGQFFGNTTVNGTPVASAVGAPGFDLAGGPQPPAGLPTAFSARYTGWLEPTTSGVTQIQTVSDDGARVWVDGQLVIDDWAGHTATAATGSVKLLVGRRVPVMIEYFQAGSTGSLQFSWQPPGANAMAPVPVARLYPAMAPATTNLALNGPTLSSATAYGGSPSRAVDGNTDGAWADGSVISTNDNQAQGWWQVDLQKTSRVDLVQLWNRTDCCVARLQNFMVFFSASDMSTRTVADLRADASVVSRSVGVSSVTPNIGLPGGLLARYVRVQALGNDALNLAEVQVWGSATYSTPSITAVAAQRSALGSTVGLTPTGSDSAGGALVWGATGLPAGLTIDPNTGRMSGVPATAGASTVSLSAVNASGLQATTSFTWQVNVDALGGVAAPIAAAGASVSYSPTVPTGATGSYVWTFGDGSAASTASSSPAISHTFAAPGVYNLLLTAQFSDGTSVIYSLLQAVTTAGATGATTAQASSSSNVLVEPRASASARLWVVNADSNSVSVFDTAGNAKLAEIPVGAAPRTLALGSDGRIWVSNKQGASLSVLSPSTLTVAQTVALPRASQPHGVVVSPKDGSVFVALEATGQVLKLDGSSGAQTAVLSVGPTPRHLAMTASGDKLLVSRYISRPLPGEGTATVTTTDASGNPLGGEVLVVDPASMKLGATVVLRHSDKTDLENAGRGLPNYLSAAAISPDGASAWVPSKQDNVKRGALRDGSALTFQNTVRAISSRLDLGTGAEDVAARVDHDNAGVPSAARYHPSGAYLFVALETNRQVAVVDPAGKRELFRIEVGLAPQGLAFSADGNTLYVNNFMARSVSVIDLTPLIGAGNTSVRTLATLNATATEPLAADVLRGKQYFYDARDIRLARDSYMSCAACHNDGGHDGRTWDMTSQGEGLRNTIALNGRAGMGHGALHWSGNFDEVQDFEGQIRSLAGGTGLMSDALFNAGNRSLPLGSTKAGLSADLDALAAYLGSLSTFAPSPNRNADGTLTATAVAGMSVFAGNCASCHGGTNFTNSAAGTAFNIGTIKSSSGTRLSGPLTGIDIPTLRDVWSSAPYLHDGSAPTLAAAVSAHNNVTLNAADLASVVAYLQQIGGEEPYAPVNLALGQPTSTSSADYSGWPGLAVDGNTDGVYNDKSVTHTYSEAQPWWQVDLGQPSDIQSVRLWNRTDCCADRLTGATVFVSASDMGGRTLAQLTADASVFKVAVPALNGAPSVSLPVGVQGRYVKVQLSGTGVLSLAEVQVFGLRATNYALGKKATQSSLAYGGDPTRAIDGNTDGVWNDGSVSHTDFEFQPWWQVDLGQAYALNSLRLFNRTDCCGDRLGNFTVLTSASDMTGRTLAQLLADSSVKRIPVWSLGASASLNLNLAGTLARYVRVQLVGSGYLSLAEVQVLGSRVSIAQGKAASQSSTVAGGDPSRAVDGNSDGNFGHNSVTHTDSDAQAWWQVDLGQQAAVDIVQLWGRTDCCADRLSNFSVFVSPTDMTGRTYAQLQADTTIKQVQVISLGSSPSIDLSMAGAKGRYVRVQLSGTNNLSLAEVKVFAP